MTLNDRHVRLTTDMFEMESDRFVLTEIELPAWQLTAVTQWGSVLANVTTVLADSTYTLHHVSLIMFVLSKMCICGCVELAIASVQRSATGRQDP